MTTSLRSLAVVGALALGLTACNSGSGKTDLPPTASPVEATTSPTAATTTLETTTTLTGVDLVGRPAKVREVFVAQVAFNHCGEDLGQEGAGLNTCMGEYIRSFSLTLSTGFPDQLATLQDVLSAQVASEHCGEGIGFRDAALLDCMFKYVTGQPTPPTTKGP